MTLTEAIKEFEKENPEREVIHAGFYNNGYLLVAPGKNLGLNDSTNPIYFVDKEGKNFIRKSPTDDIIGITASLSSANRAF